MKTPIEGYLAVLRDGSIWAAKGTLLPEPGVARMLPYRLGSTLYRVRGLGEALRLARLIYPWYMRHDPCIDATVPLVPLKEIARIIDPRKAAENWRDLGILRLLEETSPGVTGSLALGIKGRDLDIVVYGWRKAMKAYEILAELRTRGITSPLRGPHLIGEYWKNAADTPIPLENYRRLVEDKLLLGVYGGRAYSVRLVPSTEASLCLRRILKLGWCELEARITSSPAPYLTPTLYQIEVLRAKGPWRKECGDVGYIETHRIRFMEYSEGIIVYARGLVELRGSDYILVPDYPGGVVVPVG